MFHKPRRDDFSRLLDPSSFLDPWLLLVLCLLPFLLVLPFYQIHDPHHQAFVWMWGAHRLAVLTPPGYPLYVLAAKTFSLLIPWGDLVRTYSLFNLACGSAAACAFYLAGRRLRFSPLVSFSGSLLLLFSPYIWQECLSVKPAAFHLFLMMLGVMLTLHMPINVSRPWSTLLRLLWALTCGVIAGQSGWLLPWMVAAFGAGLFLGTGRHHAEERHAGLLTLAFAAGCLLPYAFLFWRLIVSLLQADAIFAWMHHGTPWQRWQGLLASVASFFRDAGPVGELGARLPPLTAFSPLSLAIFGWGLLLNLARMFLKTTDKTLSDGDHNRRLLLALLPCLVLLANALFFRTERGIWWLNLSLAAAFWSLAGLDFCYLKLGHAQLRERIQKHISHPSLFGAVAVLCVPLVAFFPAYLFLADQGREIRSDVALAGLRQLVKLLPDGAVAVFDRSDQTLPFHYLQTQERLRPDVALASLSHASPLTLDPAGSYQPWSTPLTGPVRPCYAFAHRDSASPFLRRLAQYGSLSLQYRVNAGRSAAGTPALWRVYRFTPWNPASLPVAAILPYPVTFGNRLRLRACTATPTAAGSRWLGTIQVDAAWELLKDSKLEETVLVWWVTPKSSPGAVILADGRRVVWKETLAATGGVRSRRGAEMAASYQWPAPGELKPGRYAVQLAAADRQGKFLPVRGRDERYFVTVAEVDVLEGGSAGERLSP